MLTQAVSLLLDIDYHTFFKIRMIEDFIQFTWVDFLTFSVLLYPSVPISHQPTTFRSWRSLVFKCQQNPTSEYLWLWMGETFLLQILSFPVRKWPVNIVTIFKQIRWISSMSLQKFAIFKSWCKQTGNSVWRTTACCLWSFWGGLGTKKALYLHFKGAKSKCTPHLKVCLS